MARQLQWDFTFTTIECGYDFVNVPVQLHTASQNGYHAQMKHQKNAPTLKTAAILTFAATFAVFVASCERRATLTSGPATEMRFGITTEPSTLDPLSPLSTADGRSILFNVFEGLVKPDTEGRHLPAVAESYQVRQGGRIYEFTLRENIVFHDGSPLTQEDVRFTLETAATAGLAGLDAIESVDAVGERDIRITLKRADPDFLPYLTVGIVKADSTDRDRIAIGTGPFMIESHAIQQSLVLRRFDDYREAGVPRLEKVVVVFMADPNAVFLALQAGSIDGAFLTGGIIRQIDPARFDITPVPSAMVQALFLNNAAPPFDDARVRRALNFAIARQEIIDVAFFEYGTQAGGPVIPGLALYCEPDLIYYYPHDPERAAALLYEAGFGFAGRKLSFEIVVPSNYTMHVDTAQVIVSQLAGIGVDARIRLVDWATWISDVYIGRDFQSTIISVDGRTASPRSFLERYRSGDEGNFLNFSNADFDRVFAMTFTEPDEAARIELYMEAQRIIASDPASVYIQDILGFLVFRAGAFGGILGYPLAATDFASMYGR